MFEFIVFLFLVALPIAAIVFVKSYNRLHGRYQEAKSSYSAYRLCANKVDRLAIRISESVRESAIHESQTFQGVARSENPIARFEDQVSHGGVAPTVALERLARAYPELQTSDMYLEHQRSMKELEEDQENAGIQYDACAETFNKLRGSIPTRFYAPMMGFSRDLPQMTDIMQWMDRGEDVSGILDQAYDKEKLDQQLRAKRAKGVELLGQSREAIARQGARLTEGTKDGIGAIKGRISAPDKEEVPEKAAEVPEQAAEVPEQVAEVPEQAAEVPEQVADVPQQVGEESGEKKSHGS